MARHLLARSAASLLIALALVTTSAAAASAAVSGRVDVAAGDILKLRSTPSTTGTQVGTLADGATVSITCKASGTSVTGTFGTTNQWAKIGTAYASLAYISPSGTVPSCTTTSTTNGTVDVAAGNTLKVRSTPNTSGTILSSLNDGAKVTISCKTTGTSVTGTFGTTTQWGKIGSGYASLAYIATTGTIANCTTTTPPPTSSNVTTMINWGKTQVGTYYVGCAAGSYRFGKVAPSALSHDGRTCGQTRVYSQPAGSVGYDCSGLMVEMFKRAGITLSHQSSTAIKAYVPQVTKSLSSMKPGDMLAKNGHVAMYIGNNQIIESTPYSNVSGNLWKGTRVTSADSYMNSSSYTVHRVAGL